MTVGVLALQGSFAEHEEALRRVGATPVLVRLPAHLSGIEGLIIPGGESTTIGKLLINSGLLEPLREAVNRGMPVYGTCAGMILLARDIGGMDQPLIGVMDITVKRNAFGRQVDSFEESLSVPSLGAKPFRGVFIRAPLIEKTGSGVTVLAKLSDGRVVAARQGKLLATAFHPELTDDARVHRYFLDMIENRAA
ncbi:MAG TPA: pyridoxal 5'-phosphate synthase glutaminase subunit PdxT [Spirochaetia bacterium]|nr:pyridoxal 5'-phosphate synthase glutaminase subunit PdxT [Spirochaetia bacterium]